MSQRGYELSGRNLLPRLSVECFVKACHCGGSAAYLLNTDNCL